MTVLFVHSYTLLLAACLSTHIFSNSCVTTHIPFYPLDLLLFCLSTYPIPLGYVIPLAYTKAVASSAGVSTTAVTGLTAIQGRRLLAGVNMNYQINTAASTANFFPAGGSAVASPTSSQVHPTSQTYPTYNMYPIDIYPSDKSIRLISTPPITCTPLISTPPITCTDRLISTPPITCTD